MDDQRLYLRHETRIERARLLRRQCERQPIVTALLCVLDQCITRHRRIVTASEDMCLVHEHPRSRYRRAYERTNLGALCRGHPRVEVEALLSQRSVAPLTENSSQQHCNQNLLERVWRAREHENAGSKWFQQRGEWGRRSAKERKRGVRRHSLANAPDGVGSVVNGDVAVIFYTLQHSSEIK